MSKITLNNLVNLQNENTAVATINNNSALIQATFDNTISRDGTQPNQMQSILDMNSNQIINLPNPATANSPLRLQDLSNFVGGGTVTNIPLGGNTGDALVKNSNANFDVKWTADSGIVAAGTNIAVTGTSPATVSTINNPTFSGTVTANTFVGALAAGTVLTTPVINGISTGTGVSVAATPNTLVLRDAAGNSVVNSVLSGYTTTVTAAGTTTLTVSSSYNQYFTGATTQTIVLPVTSTLSLGQSYRITNLSTGAVTIQSSGLNTVIIVPGNGCVAIVTCILTSGTTAASWNPISDFELVASGKVLNVSNSLTLAGTDGTTMTFPTTSATVARTDAGNTFIGTQNLSSLIASSAVATDGSKNIISVTNTGSGNNVLANSPIINSSLLGYTTTATAGGNTTLTVANTYWQTFTGTLNQTVTLPVTTTLIVGFQFCIDNNSTGLLTVNSSGGGTVAFLPGGTAGIFTCILASGTTPTSWTVDNLYRAGQISGTPTTDNANAGNIGEVISANLASGSAVNLTTVTVANIVQISLTAGDWDLYGWANFAGNVATSQSSLIASMGTVSATLDPVTPFASLSQSTPAQLDNGATNTFSLGPLRASLSTTTTYFLCVRATFTINTMSAFGSIRARRIR